MKHSKKRSNKTADWKKLVGLFFGLTLFTLSTVWLVRGIRISQWTGQAWFGVVEQDKEIVVKLISLKQKKVISFLIPAETMVNVGFGFGEYRIGKVAELGGLEKKPGLVLTRSIQDLLGVPVSGWKIYKHSNLTWWDKIRLFWFEKFKVTNRERIVLEESLAWQKDYLSDKTQVFRVNLSFIDQLVHEQIFNQELAEEGLSVAVLNATGVDGVASNLARLASNLGIEVRLVSNSLKQDISVIKIDNEKYKTSLTVKSLSQALNIKTIEVIDTFEYRSDVVIVVGQDYTKL